MKHLAVALFFILYLALAQPAEAMRSGKDMNRPLIWGRPACKVCVEIHPLVNATPV